MITFHWGSRLPFQICVQSPHRSASQCQDLTCQEQPTFPVYHDVGCTSSNSTAPLDSSRDPKIPIPPQTMVHTRRSGNVTFPFDNSLRFDRIRPDVGRRSTHQGRDHNWPMLPLSAIIELPESSSMLPYMSHVLCRQHWVWHDSPSPSSSSSSFPSSSTASFSFSSSSSSASVLSLSVNCYWLLLTCKQRLLLVMVKVECWMLKFAKGTILDDAQFASLHFIGSNFFSR